MMNISALLFCGNMIYLEIKITRALVKLLQIITLPLDVSFLRRIPDAEFKYAIYERALKCRRRARAAVHELYFCYTAYLHRRDTFFGEHASQRDSSPLELLRAHMFVSPMTEFTKAASSPEKYRTFLTDATQREATRRAEKKRRKKQDSSRRFSLCSLFYFCWYLYFYVLFVTEKEDDFVRIRKRNFSKQMSEFLIWEKKTFKKVLRQER